MTEGGMTRRAVITGLGAVSPLGVGADALINRWSAGETGIIDGDASCREHDVGRRHVFQLEFAFDVGDAHLFQPLDNEGGGFMHLVHQFGVLVQVTAPARDFGLHLGEAVLHGHGAVSCQAGIRRSTSSAKKLHP